MHPIWQEIRSIDAGRRAVRSFGFVVGGVLLALGVVVWWRHDWSVATTAAVLWSAGGTLVAGGLAVPSALRPLYRVWMALAVVMGYVMTRVLLTVVFFLVLTPVAVVMRWLGRDPMRRDLDPEATTYWVEKEYESDARARLEKYY